MKSKCILISGFFLLAGTISSIYAGIVIEAIPIIAVMPFENNSADPNLNWLSNAVAETVSSRLCFDKRIKVVERSQLQNVMKEIKLSAAGAVDPSSQVRAGKLLGAKYLLLGGFQIYKDSLWLQSRVIDTETGVNLGSAEVMGKKDEIFLLQRRLAEQVLMRILPESGRVLLKSDFFQRIETSRFNDFEYSEKARAIVAKIPKLELNPLRNRDFPEFFQALDYLKKVLEDNVSNPEANLYCAILYMNLDKDEQALEYFNKTIYLAYDYADAYFYLGNFYRSKNEHEKALSNYGKALSFDENHAYAYYGAAVTNRRIGSDDLSIKQIFKALENRPDLSEAELFLKSIMRETGPASASVRYGNLLRINPKHAEANLLLGLKEAFAGNLDTATPMLEKSLEAYPRMALSYYYIGLGYLRKGNISEAEVYLSNTVRLYPTFPEANIELAKIYQQTNKYANAVVHYKTYLYFSTEGSNFPEVQNRIKECEHRLGRGGGR